MKATSSHPIKIETQTSVETVIIGSGFSGLGMAIQLKMKGIDDFLVLERADEVGGVWRDNSYPGCACDVESYLYSFSFAPNPNWTRRFSGQQEIWDYLRDCADRFDVRRHLRFNQELLKAVWDAKAQAWQLETSQGRITARILISGTGAFSEALVPPIPGLTSFQGMSFHSSDWQHDYDLAGRKVAVIGTGASAIQFIPRIQAVVDSLSVFQRTPPWILPKADKAIPGEEKKRFTKFPLLQKASRLFIYAQREAYGTTFRYPKLMGFGKEMALHHMRKRIKDPILREKLTPNYEIGCKRVLLSNDYYPALAKPNVAVITDPIMSISTKGVVTQDGKEHRLDAIIWGTGFRVTEFAIAHRIVGKDGKSLSDHWQGAPGAYLGTTVSGFPNYFTLLGPNTGLGHSSVVLMIEAQIELVLSSVQYFRKKKLSEMEPDRARELAFIKEVDKLSSGTVWLSGGCKSWYLDSTGRNSTLWPSSIGSFRRRILPFRRRDYTVKEAK